MNDKLLPYGNEIQIKADWWDGKKKGIQVGEPVFVEQWWVPVLWPDEDDPDFHKEAGLDGVIRRTPDARLEAERAVIEAAREVAEHSYQTHDEVLNRKISELRRRGKELHALARTEK